MTAIDTTETVITESATKPFKIAIEGEELREYAQLGQARVAARKHAARINKDVEVTEIDSETGRRVVAYLATPVMGRNFKPWERIENIEIDGLRVPAVEGWTPAYSRKKIKVVVYRPQNKHAGWLVWDGRSDAFTLCKNTVISQKLTVRLKDEELVGQSMDSLLEQSIMWVADAEKAKA